ncbi:hypothetical protein LX69_02211, partial [Breznakibacter xylanolyticus]
HIRIVLTKFYDRLPTFRTAIAMPVSIVSTVSIAGNGNGGNSGNGIND